MKKSAQQLTLKIHLSDEASFKNFYTPEANQVLMAYLQAFILGQTESFLYLWGMVGSGRSHLLQACCHAMHAQRQSVVYLPLLELKNLSPEIFVGLESYALVCLDDVDAIVGKAAWEEALFHLYNKLFQSKSLLLISGNSPANLLNFKLADLDSRIAGGGVSFQVQSLSDDEKLKALQLRAEKRGLELPMEVAQFLLNFYARDTVSLFNNLEKLDKASLVTQRRLTIPFVKQVLEEQ
jgi:DnaA family protein